MAADPRSDVVKGPHLVVREKQRSRTGCKVCRQRKVKCDERLGGCRNCERLNIHCPSSSVSLTPPDGASCGRDDEDGCGKTQAGIPRRRTYRSCKGCRSSKSRCSGERPVCARCTQRTLECVYDGKQVPAWVEAIGHGPDLGSSDAGTTSGQSLTPGSSPAGSSRRSSSYVRDFDEESSTASPGRNSLQVLVPSHLGWLMSPELPNKERVVLLIEEYFVNIHSLRSFGFVHRPAFMQQLEERLPTGDRDDILLYTLCALGAKYYALRCATAAQLAEGFALTAGKQWAEKALYFLFTNLNCVSVESTMAIVLLHEHELRVGNYASAFTLTGLAVRMAQALQINLESSSDILCLEKKGLSSSFREARRRLMWCIYSMDAWVGSGVDELTLIRDADMKIQLPCNERNFVFQTPCVVETMQPGTWLPFVTAEIRAKGPVDSVDLQAQFIRLISLRKQVLRYVKHLDTAQKPWLPDSEFTLLESALIRWHEELPLSLRFVQSAIYIRKESSQLGGLLFLHITYHQTLTDLNRIGMRELFKIRAPVHFLPDQHDFLIRVQDQCFDHATAIAAVYEEALRHGPEALADTWLSVVAHDAARVIVHYTVNGLGSASDRVPGSQVESSLHALLCALKKMTPIHSLAKPLHAAAVVMFKKAGILIPQDLDTNSTTLHSASTSETERPTPHGNPAQYTPEYVLNPLAIYRMARKDINDGEKHAPENSPSTCLPLGSRLSSPRSQNPPITSSVDPGLVVDDESTNLLNPGVFADPELHFPTGIDAYLPLMLGNYSLTMQPSFDEVSTGSDFGGYSSIYPIPPESNVAMDVDVPMTSGPPFSTITQPAWSVG